MKLKVVSTPLFLAGSAYAQLISGKNESGVLSAYANGTSLAFTGNETSIPLHMHSPFRSSLSFRENVSAATVFEENPGFGASSHGLGLHRFATYSMAGARNIAFSDAVDPIATSEIHARTHTDTFPAIEDQDHEDFALLAAASTQP